MKIDKKKLVELLTEKTGLEKKEVESQLDELISRIQGAARKGKALEIKGFGMFYFSKEGELKFDPSEDLKTEVNHKYTGMDPVEIKKPRKTADTPTEEASGKSEDADDSGKQEKVWGFDEEADVEETPSKEEKKQKDEVKEESAAPKKEKSSDKDAVSEEKTDHDIFAQFDHGKIKVPGKKDKKEDDQTAPVKKEKAEEEKQSEGKEADTTGSISKETGKEAESTPAKPGTKAEQPAGTMDAGKKKTPEIPKSTRKTPVRSVDKKGNNPAFKVISAIVVILVVIIGIIVALDLTDSDPATDQQDVQADVFEMEPQPQAPPDVEEEMDDLQPIETPVDEPEDIPETTEQDEPPAIEDTDVPETGGFGLYGSAVPIDDRHYSIILHSMRTEQIASGLRDELQEEGYRAIIYSVDHEEQGTMWRVGIGQFETIADAQNAAADLPQNYQDNHFIGLIQ
jgi:hypothetical protein